MVADPEDDDVSTFINKRHLKPDYSADLSITGVRLPGGVINWQVTVSEDYNPLLIAQIFEKSAIVLRGESDAIDRPKPTGRS